jgi:hypothetical protein
MRVTKSASLKPGGGRGGPAGGEGAGGIKPSILLLLLFLLMGGHRMNQGCASKSLMSTGQPYPSLSLALTAS